MKTSSAYFQIGRINEVYFLKKSRLKSLNEQIKSDSLKFSIFKKNWRSKEENI
jgi:hypothetical protein